MNWLKSFFNNNSPSVPSTGIATAFHIPEPTNSLLWITDEDVSKISYGGALTFTISLGANGTTAKLDKEDGYFSEPSLIWKKLPIEVNEDLEKDPMYFPSYSRLSPAHRYQYLSWLKDVTGPTNLSYVFLYYYGLERHLLIGKYQEAVEEILRLLQYHDRGTFRSYAQKALLVAGIHKKDFELFKNNNFIFDGCSNEVLLVKKMMGQSIRAHDIIKLANHVGFTNKRYIKLHPEIFELELDKLQKEYEYINGPILEAVDVSKLSYEVSSVFANTSIPDKSRQISVPQLLSDKTFKGVLRELLEKTHQCIKENKSSKV